MLTGIEQLLKMLPTNMEAVPPTTALTRGARGRLHLLPGSHLFSAVGGLRTAGLRHILILLLRWWCRRRGGLRFFVVHRGEVEAEVRAPAAGTVAPGRTLHGTAQAAAACL